MLAIGFKPEDRTGVGKADDLALPVDERPIELHPARLDDIEAVSRITLKEQMVVRLNMACCRPARGAVGRCAKVDCEAVDRAASNAHDCLL